jgi:hypothetical protein
MAGNYIKSALLQPHFPSTCTTPFRIDVVVLRVQFLLLGGIFPRSILPDFDLQVSVLYQDKNYVEQMPDHARRAAIGD